MFLNALERDLELDLPNIYLAPTVFQVFSESLLCVCSYLSLTTNLSGKLTTNLSGKLTSFCR